MIYQTFATLYDELFDPAMYNEWLDFVQSEHPSKQAPFLDLACGTGRLAVLLGEQGYQVSGLDFSSEMLALAQTHADEAGLTIPLIEGNMLDLSEIGQYQTVTCFADSLCYLADETQLGTAFKQVAAHLASNGQFLFDVITPHQTNDIYPGYMYNYQDEQQTFVWTSYAGETPNSAEHDLTFFTYNEEREAYDRVTETHYEQTYPLATYQRLLMQAGFNQVKVTADFGKAQPDGTTTRWFFTCQKG